jgi:hypothetical protein
LNLFLIFQLNRDREAFWLLCNDLHQSVFHDNGPSVDLEAVFSKHGLSLGMTEGKLTKKNTRLMSLRKDRFEGADIDITPHLKMAHTPTSQTLRIYFAIDRTKDRFIVGEITDHLDTAGTSRRS